VARFSEAEETLIWDWWKQGGSMRGVARELDRSSSSVRTMIESHGGVRPVPRCRSVRHLSLEEREEISRGLASGDSLRSIAVRLGRWKNQSRQTPRTINEETLLDDVAAELNEVVGQLREPFNPLSCRLDIFNRGLNPDHRSVLKGKYVTH